MKRIYFLIIFLLFALVIFPDTSRKEIVSSLFKSVENWMGTDYKYGGISENGIDCSAFVIKVYKEVFNKNLPRTVKDQKNLGEKVTGTLEPGDLIFFNINGEVRHVGIYVFNNKFIHAASAGPETGVIKSSLNEKYYKERFTFARRIITLPPYLKEEKKKKLEKDYAWILSGKVLFQGNLLEGTDTFNENKPIYLAINKRDEKKEYKIAVKQIIGDESKLIDDFKCENILINSKDSKKKFLKISLLKGSYQLLLTSDKNNVIFQKNILVN